MPDRPRRGLGLIAVYTPLLALDVIFQLYVLFVPAMLLVAAGTLLGLLDRKDGRRLAPRERLAGWSAVALGVLLPAYFIVTMPLAVRRFFSVEALLALPELPEPLAWAAFSGLFLAAAFGMARSEIRPPLRRWFDLSLKVGGLCVGGLFLLALVGFEGPRTATGDVLYALASGAYFGSWAAAAVILLKVVTEPPGRSRRETTTA